MRQRCYVAIGRAAIRRNLHPLQYRSNKRPKNRLSAYCDERTQGTRNPWKVSKLLLTKAWDAQVILLRFQFLELGGLALRVFFAPGAAVRLREKEMDLGAAGHQAAGRFEFANGV